MNCDECGAEISEATFYCHSCGAALVPNRAQPRWQRVVIAGIILLPSLPAGLCSASATWAGFSALILDEEYSILPGFLVLSVPTLLLGMACVYLAVRVLKN
jgi:hypothetical protein